jgi:hypothetical protein
MLKQHRRGFERRKYGREEENIVPPGIFKLFNLLQKNGIIIPAK